jgi:hypothetical protein
MMPVLHRAIAALAITMLVLSLIYVAQQIAFNSLVSIPSSAQRSAAKKIAPPTTVATLAAPGRVGTKVVGRAGRPAPSTPAKKRSM